MKWWLYIDQIQNAWEVADMTYFKIIFYPLPKMGEENHELLSQESW
jgi:hypothetical protein